MPSAILWSRDRQSWPESVLTLYRSLYFSFHPGSVTGDADDGLTSSSYNSGVIFGNGSVMM